MKIIAVANQKGGAGKTTACVQLSRALVRQRGRRSLRLLVVDLDAQHDASDLLLGTFGPGQAPGQDDQPRVGSYELLTEDRPLEELVRRTPSGVDLCAASARLAGLEMQLLTRRGSERRLRDALRAVPPDTWDIVLLDCPPSLGLATVNALVCADAVLTPIMPEALVLKSVGPLSTSIGIAVQHNPALRHLGFLLSRVSLREALTDQVRQQLRQCRLAEASGTPLWRSFIRTDPGLKAWPPRRGRGMRDYEKAAKELLVRLRRLDRQRRAS